MKILFIAQAKLNKELGGPKVVIEIAEIINKIGHKADVVGPEEIEKFLENNGEPVNKKYSKNVKSFLNIVVNDYDVIDADINSLFDFELKNRSKTLIVGRSVLFYPHVEYIKWPIRKTLINMIGYLLKGKFFKNLLNKRLIDQWYKTLEFVDYINVSNKMDLDLLLHKGFEKKKIIQLSYGLTESRRLKLNSVSVLPNSSDNIVFVGTFDFRKGCVDIPKIFEEIKKELPYAKLYLVGAKGLFRNKEVIYDFFSNRLRNDVHIVLDYQHFELPTILEGMKVGIFPSYLEGFPFAVIEVLAAGIPVIAYNAPGPSDMLPREYLVETGDYISLANKVIKLLQDEQGWIDASNNALKISATHNWEEVAAETINIYENKLLLKRTTNI